LVSAKKDCIGKTMSEREGLCEDSREQLVGLKPVGAVKQLTAGAHLFNETDDATRVKDQGYVIYPGKLTVADSFRMGCIGRLDQQHMRAALVAVRNMLDKFGIERINSIS